MRGGGGAGLFDPLLLYSLLSVSLPDAQVWNCLLLATPEAIVTTDMLLHASHSVKALVWRACLNSDPSLLWSYNVRTAAPSPPAATGEDTKTRTATPGTSQWAERGGVRALPRSSLRGGGGCLSRPFLSRAAASPSRGQQGLGERGRAEVAPAEAARVSGQWPKRGVTRGGGKWAPLARVCLHPTRGELCPRSLRQGDLKEEL